MLRVRHPDVEADATCVDEAQYLAVYAPKGWALVVDEDGTPVDWAESDQAAGTPAPVPAPVVEVVPDDTPPESPVSNPEPMPDPADFVDFETIPASDPITPTDADAVESEED
jgi:hypothetical protein